MGEVIRPGYWQVTQSPPHNGTLEVWQDTDGSWLINHTSRWGDSAGIVRIGIADLQEAMRQAHDLALQYSYHFDELAYTGSHS